MEVISAKAGAGVRLNEHMEDDGETVFRHVCRLGYEGIVSKRLGSHYCSGRSPDGPMPQVTSLEKAAVRDAPSVVVVVVVVRMDLRQPAIRRCLSELIQ